MGKFKTIDEQITSFCREKYGVNYPKDIGLGNIVWMHVPAAWGRIKSPKHIANIPYLRPKEADQPGSPAILDTYTKLATEQLALLGIDFDPYKGM